MPQTKKKSNSAPPEETKAAEALTIAWTTTVVTGLMCDVGAAVSRLVAEGQPEVNAIGMLAGLLFFAATAVGVLSLVMLPFVLKARNEPPPSGFIVFAIVVATAPIAALLVQSVK
jgi:hypothetical protein